MPGTRTLLIVFAVALVITIAFVFTWVGIAGAAIAALTLLALLGRGVDHLIRHTRASRASP